MQRTTQIAIPLLFLLSCACASTLPNRSTLGEPFPAVQGNSLDGTSTRLPQDVAGAPCILLIGYTQRSQFDIDRWILGLMQLESQVRLIEIPTIEGLLPGLFANRIDDGMRGGIPREDWPSVVTVYGDATKIREFTGTESESNARVLLLDDSGTVRWMTDRGYSASQVRALHEATLNLGEQP